MVDLGFMKLPCAGDFSVFKLLFGMACASGLPTAPFYTLAHFKCHTRKHKSKSA